jgi:hypothetical protein
MERDAYLGEERELPRSEEEFGLTPDPEDPKLLEEDLFARTDPRIFVTDPDNVEEARTFVWADTSWYERIEGDRGRRVLTCRPRRGRASGVALRAGPRDHRDRCR